MFIVLSGFALTYSCLRKYEPVCWRQWYLRRADRILPTYWIMSVTGFLLVVIMSILMSRNARAEIVTAATHLALDVALLRNFSHQTMFSDPNASLWFGPFILGFYLVHQSIYRHHT